MSISYRDDLVGIDWVALTASLRDDDFDNGRTPEQLRLSFERSWTTVVAHDGGTVVGTARLLADGVCNAYLVDVWTASAHRRQGVASVMVRHLVDAVPGHHIALFTADRTDFYETLGFEAEEVGMSRVSGTWLNQ